MGILVLASHNERLIECVCNRVMRLEGGAVTADRSAGREVPAAS